MGYQKQTGSVVGGESENTATRGPQHEHMRRAGAAILWVGAAGVLYLMLGLPLAFASLELTRFVAAIFAAPALPAALFMRLGLHPIAAVAVTFLLYWAAGYGVIEWRAHHRQAAGGAVLISR